VALTERDKVVLKKKKENTALETLLTSYSHWCVCKEVRIVLDKIADGLPNIFVHWSATGNPLTASVELNWDRLSVSMLIERSSISFGDGLQTIRSSIFTADELGKFILFRISTRILEDLYKDLASQQIRVMQNELALNVVFPQKAISISLQTEADFSIQILISEICKDSKDGIETEHFILKWNLIPGEDAKQKN